MSLLKAVAEKYYCRRDKADSNSYDKCNKVAWKEQWISSFLPVRKCEVYAYLDSEEGRMEEWERTLYPLIYTFYSEGQNTTYWDKAKGA